ncbi:2-oxoacid:acceptor oxidoreductase family protein [Schaalia sp. 19OD2882]|uniref:2-oxoacid:acceptor oxidoreductase family protein n=1 Tax=Schaalia sp. 19OD2882 TaxID=2794089 RepID=UPI001C1EA495|nr:2-oxoacid:acceptor oxidoreductase family protein [Schaalia sp. 19OD2882]QWW19672.1 2-oxoacid:acceptor oxidoreductase family protein [Schaalia sp. 19OD2882]
MVEVRIHGRGGQGVVTASDLLAMAAFTDGHHAQAFPSFGSERTGAPVVSFCRITDAPIRTREPVLEPDLVIVQDPTLLAVMDVFAGLKPDGYALINSGKSLEDLELTHLLDGRPAGRIVTIPAFEIAKEHLGRPVPNVVMLAGAAALTGLIRLDSMSRAIRERFPGKIGEANVRAAAAAHDLVRSRIDEAATTHDGAEDTHA